MIVWIALAASFVISVLLHVVALRVFPVFGLLDFPERYGLSRPRLPYPTGILAVLIFLAFYLVLEEWSLRTMGVVLATSILGVTTFLDDRTPLPSSIRLLVQIVVALIIFLTGTRIYSLTNPLAGWTGEEVIKLDTLVILSPFFSDPSIVGALFTVLWLGLTMNALNWFDGIPGQVSTLSTIGFLTIGFLSLSSRVEQPDLALLAFILAGISLGGLLFDFPLPRILMGDTGSMFFGLMLGVLTIYAGGKVATAFLVLGVPLTDSFLVILQRILKGTSPLRGSLAGEHLHHRLLAKGWDERQVILLTALLGAAFGVTALFLDTLGKFIAALLLFLLMLVLSLYARPRASLARDASWARGASEH